MNRMKVDQWKKEMEHHLHEELLPFWLDRCWDTSYGGFVTQFDTDGNLTDTDEKSLLAHMRTVYTLSLAAQHGHDKDGRCRELACKGVRFALDVYWDSVYGGFYWLLNRENQVINNQKIVYGQSFAIYALATFAKVFDDKEALSYAERCFDLLQIYAAETSCGGYWEMFERDWTLCGPGAAGGDRKTLDVHMHLMEAFTSLFEASGKDIHHRKLIEIIDILVNKIMHPEYSTGIPQFTKDWQVAPQIKFDVIWGWDRYDSDSGQKVHEDNTSYGHNVEFFWLLMRALTVLNETHEPYNKMFEKILNHAVSYGVDQDFGGIYVEGSAAGSAVYDDTKEFWQQAEFLIGMLEAYLVYHDERYLSAYENVHDFVMNHMIKHEVGEWWPLLTREGTPIWKHMSHSWKVNYHTIRGAVYSILRLEKISQVI